MREPWVCPRCRRELRIANQEHVCELYDLDFHFEDRDPIGVVAFDWVCSVLQRLGGYTVLPMKTFIGFANGVNFAFLKVKKRGAELSVVLANAPETGRFQFVCAYSKSKSIYKTLIREDSDLDEELSSLLEEAFTLTL